MSEYSFGELLIAFRNRKRVSQRKLAELINYEGKAPGRWERHETRPPDREIVLKIAEALALNVIDTNLLLESAGYIPKPLAVEENNLRQTGESKQEEKQSTLSTHKKIID